MHKEEQEHLLHTTNKGFVNYCQCCEQFQIGFGNAITVLDRSQFWQLQESLSGIDPFKVPGDRMPNGKTHLIRNSCQSFMAFDGEEMAELQELFDGAEAGLKVIELMRTN